MSKILDQDVGYMSSFWTVAETLVIPVHQLSYHNYKFTKRLYLRKRNALR